MPDHLIKLKLADMVYDESNGRVSAGKKAFIQAAIERAIKLDKPEPELPEVGGVSASAEGDPFVCNQALLV